MYQITLLNRLLTEYKIWTLKLKAASKAIEDNILQIDASNGLEEKITSIVLSSLVMYIGTGIIGLFGVSMHGIGISIVLFVAGWLLSKYIKGTSKNPMHQ